MIADDVMFGTLDVVTSRIVASKVVDVVDGISDVVVVGVVDVVEGVVVVVLVVVVVVVVVVVSISTKLRFYHKVLQQMSTADWINNANQTSVLSKD